MQRSPYPIRIRAYPGAYPYAPLERSSVNGFLAIIWKFGKVKYDALALLQLYTKLNMKEENLKMKTL